MMNKYSSIFSGFKQGMRLFKFVYAILLIILLSALFVRVYRATDLLRFYYDQGRDALVIWDFWHNNKLFLIGPVTGLAGIFLGPFYYYLIAPFYLIGGGNPAYPAVFLSFLSVLALFVVYKLGKDMQSKITGLLAVFIGGFSYYIFTAGRWLSNPTPILLTSVILLFSMWMLIKQNTLGKNKFGGLWWVMSFLMIGLSLQFESASAVFYIPMLIVFMTWYYLRFDKVYSSKGREVIFKQLKNDIPILVISILVFIFTLLPQIIFNFRHQNILFNNFKKLFMEEQSFRGLTMFIFEEKMKFFWSVFETKIFAGKPLYSFIIIIFSISSLVVFRKKLKYGVLQLFSIFIFVPLLFYTFFQGNQGNFYDYYLTGYYLPFILIFSIGLVLSLETSIGKILLVLFLLVFAKENHSLIKNYLTATSETRPISMEDQLKAVDWIYWDSRNRGNYNIDVYVPPVVPYAYDYLFLWQFSSKNCMEELCGYLKDINQPVLYTLYESDPPNPHRLEEWLRRQKDIGVIIEEVKFGEITVQRRQRSN